MAKYRKSFKFLLLVIVLIMLVTVIVLFIRGQKPLPVIPTPTISVQTTTVTTRAVPIVLKFPGTLEAVKTATIIPQVNGVIKKIHFQPGAMVSKNQLLFEIDSLPFNATLKQTKSNLKRDRAQLSQTQKEIDQYRMQMRQSYYVPIPRSRQNKVPVQAGGGTTPNVQQQYERAKGLANIQEATIEADKAQVRQAEIQVGYTRIRSPIAGKAGNISKKVGDLAATNNPIPLVVINQLDLLWVNFNLPQNKLTLLLTYQKKKNLQVNVFSEDHTQLLGTGELKFIDNMVDPQTGALLLKAQIANPKQILWPGLKVVVELILATEQQALVIPLNAIQLDPQGQFVYIIENGKAKIKRVLVDRETDNFAVIKQGLKNNEIVIINVPPALSEGVPVRILTTNSPEANLENGFLFFLYPTVIPIMNKFSVYQGEGRRGGIVRRDPRAQLASTGEERDDRPARPNIQIKKTQGKA